MTPAVQIADGRAEVRFGTFDLDSYAMFLRCKQLPMRALMYDRKTDVYTVTAPGRFAAFLDPTLRETPRSRHGESDRPIYVYALVDPFTNEIRYIGQSVRPADRVGNHCNDPSTTWRTNWIRSVLARGRRPILLILERVAPGAEWQQVEREWIAFGREQGWPLTNCTDGATG